VRAMHHVGLLIAVCQSGNNTSVPILLHQWRKRRGYSVRGLAERAGVGFVTVSRIEHGHMSPTVEMLEKLAKALEIDVRDFFPASRRSKRSRGR